MSIGSVIQNAGVSIKNGVIATGVGIGNLCGRAVRQLAVGARFVQVSAYNHPVAAGVTAIALAVAAVVAAYYFFKNTSEKPALEVKEPVLNPVAAPEASPEAKLVDDAAKAEQEAKDKAVEAEKAAKQADKKLAQAEKVVQRETNALNTYQTAAQAFQAAYQEKDEQVAKLTAELAAAREAKQARRWFSWA